MKMIVSTFALMTCICLGGESTAPAQETQPDADSTTQPALTPSRARKAAKLREEALRNAQRAVDVAQSKMDKVDADDPEKSVKLRDEAMRNAQRALEVAQSRMARADAAEDAEVAEVRVFDGNTGGFAFADAYNGPDRTSTQPLVIRTTELDPAGLATTQEDLSVMSRILTKALGRDRKDSAMGIVLSALPGSRRPQSIYLQGYGALFLLNVKFPLVPPPNKEEDKPEQGVDSTWEKTKQELYGSKPGYTRTWAVNATDPAAEYNPDQVENLKRDLLESLKNAANIRGLKSEESVTVAVIGNRSGGAQPRAKHVAKPSQNGSHKSDFLFAPADGSHAARDTTLTIRVKMADVEALNRATIDIDEFKKRAFISAY